LHQFYLFLLGCIICIIPAFSQILYKSKIKTYFGNFLIRNVEESDRRPTGCNERKSFCSKAPEKYKFLIVWLITEDGKGIYFDVFKHIDKYFWDATENVYVKADSGTRYFRHGTEWSANGKLTIVFMPLKEERNFKLFWPGNSSITLRK
jgi:hypothetical protein